MLRVHGQSRLGGPGPSLSREGNDIGESCMYGISRVFSPAGGGPAARPRHKLRNSFSTLGRKAMVASVCATLTGLTVVGSSNSSQAVTDENPEFFVNRADLEFILNQIKIAESHAAGGKLLCDDRADQSWTCVPDARLPYGLRTVDGTMNNLMKNRSTYGAADQVFPRLLAPEFRDADGAPFD